MRTMLKTAAVSSVVLLISLAAAAECNDKARGTWSAEPSRDNASLLQFRFTCSGENGGVDRPLSAGDLKGLDPASIQGSHIPVKFRLEREAGTFQFEGTFNAGIGYGEFNFAANRQFLADLKQMGFSDADSKSFVLATIDVTRGYIKELRDLGFHPDLDKVIAGRIFNVDRQQVEGLKAVGVTNPSLDDLVQYRIFHVTPDYIRQTRAAFPGIELDKLVAMRIHQVTPEFAQEMSRLGYANLNADQLIAFKIHGVSPEFVRQIAGLGFKGLNADHLVSFRIFNVNADQIQDLSKAGYTGLAAEDLINFRIHHIDSAFIEKVNQAGYQHPSPSQLVEFKIMGIRHRTAGL